jgi:IrrE N-terminal-like domain
MSHPLLPPGSKWRQYELRALGLRDFARARPDMALNPFPLAQLAGLLVVAFDQVRGLSPQAREHLLGHGAGAWSGGVCARPLPGGRKLVILNPAHGAARTRATLMEEICHVFLGHSPNRLSAAPPTRQGAAARDYDVSDEEAAYAVGAAALLPYASLQRLVFSGTTIPIVARRFRVSAALVRYRLQVTRLWRTYLAAQSASERA